MKLVEGRRFKVEHGSRFAGMDPPSLVPLRLVEAPAVGQPLPRERADFLTYERADFLT
jgi:hypothetical protein